MAARPANPRMATDMIEAAAALVEELGPEGVTMRLVAERIRQRAHAYVAWGLANPGMYRLMFEWGYLGDISEEAIFARRASWRRTRNVLERGAETGDYRSDLDSALAADTVWIGVHGLTSLAISGRMFGNPGVVDPAAVSMRSHQLADALADSWETAWRP